MLNPSRMTTPLLGIGDFIGNDPFGDKGQFAHRPEAWNDFAIPDWIRYQQTDIQDDIDNADKANRVNQVLSQVVGAAPIFGSFFKLFFDIPIAVTNAHIQKQRNKQERINSYFENWYNSPKQQIRRLSLAGINPFTQGQAAVRAYPASVPQYQTYQAPYLSSPSVGTMPQLLNAMTNMQLAQSRIDNLDSLTAINEYKFEELLPQLFERNGYVNNILELQSAWETGNYEYERQLKQDMLNTSYMVSLAAVGEKIMMLQPNTPGARTIVDAINGTIKFINEDGSVIDPSTMSFNQLPAFMQDAFVDIYSKQSNISLNSARQRLMSSQENQYNAMAALYNANRDKIQIDVDSYRRTGVWSTEDFTLRFAAGLLNDQTYWKNFGLNTINSLQDASVDVGSAWLNPRTLLRQQNMPVPSAVPSTPNVQPQPLKIPKGARPFTVNGKVYYYQK